MNITVVGCGRWGSCIAWYCASKKGHSVTLYGLASAPDYQNFVATRKNEYITLPDTIQLTDDLEKAINASEVIIVSIGAQQFRGFLKDMVSRIPVSGKTFVLCMKGLEASTGDRLTQIFRQEVGYKNKLAIWVGPGHVQDYYAGRPSCMLIGSDDFEVTKFLVSELNSNLIRLYYSQDLIGCELGAASKNVMGIAAGILDGFNCPGLKGALMARGAREISRLVRKMGGNELTVYGLSHLGDYQATLFSEFSHNRMYGENFIKKIPMTKLAEGVETSRALVRLSDSYKVDLPISRAVFDVVINKKDPVSIMENLFDRENKFEF